MDAGVVAIYGLALGSVSTAALVAFPAVEQLAQRWMELNERLHGAKAARATRQLDELFIDVKPTRLKLIYGLAPVVAGVLMLIMFKNIWVALVGAALGLLLPDAWIRYTQARRNAKFRTQLVDALFILSSSLKAGLSLMQAMEVVETEMGPPISQEIGLIIKAHRLGRTFEEALTNLNDRVPCEEVNLMTNVLLVGRETGGDVTGIISQLITTIRDKKKLKDKTQTLTLQGRLQAYIMSLLPVGFALLIKTFNPGYFDPLISTDLGKSLILVAVFLWLMGMFLLMRMCKVEV
jgi:tight adherence protein B